MSKGRYFGTQVDHVYQGLQRLGHVRVFVWNRNRTTINQVALGEAPSPRYEITDWVESLDYTENVVWENNEDAVSTNVTLELTYDPGARPVPITERTMVDGTPIRVYQGDQRLPDSQMVCIFTGVIRGNPGVVELTREEAKPERRMSVQAVGREEAFLNRVVTARSYEEGTDVGVAVVETAIQYMGLDRREINVGHQDYPISHQQSQLVDIEVLKGLHEMLFTVGKKPRFDAEGLLIAADTDLNKPPAREYLTRDQFKEIKRVQGGASLYNSVRLLGLDDELAEVFERRKRLAHGTMTAGFFSEKVSEKVYFSENKGKTEGGRRAKDTKLKADKFFFANMVGQDVSWTPFLEEDGVTCFGGKIEFDTGFAPWIIIGLSVAYVALKASASALRVVAAESDPVDGAVMAAAEVIEAMATLTLVEVLIAMMTMGRISWEVHGVPFQHVYQQLAVVAQVKGLLTAEVRELPLRNDWLYDVDYMERMARELLRRELIKGWAYEIEMLDDPLLEVDDVIKLPGYSFYLTSIRRSYQRSGQPPGTMSLTAWRIA